MQAVSIQLVVGQCVVNIPALVKEGVHLVLKVTQTEGNGVLPFVHGLSHFLHESGGDALLEGALALVLGKVLQVRGPCDAAVRRGSLPKD